MSELQELNDDTDEEQEMGSWFHSAVQAQIAGWFANEKRFIALVELSLDISQTDLSQLGIKAKEELKPDVCLYPKKKRRRRGEDISKMSEMPVLAIEILSPEQAISQLIAKIKAYFTLGIKSSWLVIPATESVTVYSSNFSRSPNFSLAGLQSFSRSPNFSLAVVQSFSFRLSQQRLF